MIEITKQADTEVLSKIFKALSNENRLEIFNLVRQGVGNCCQMDELGDTCSCVCDIGAEINLALSTVSHHLKELRNAGLIHCQKRGQWVYCSVNQATLSLVGDFLDQ